MIRKLCVKRLTASDLTLFEWQFRNLDVGNQKAINLNADIFIDVLYPSLPDALSERSGRFPLDLFVYGPGLESVLNLQRKIIKFGSYKNWRLDGEFIHNPEDSPDRFNVLVPGDLAVIEFVGATVPHTAQVVFIAQNHAEDTQLHTAFTEYLGSRRMAVLFPLLLKQVVTGITYNPEHPVHELLLNEHLEDAALGGADGTRRLATRSTRATSPDELLRAKAAAEATGQLGEQFVNDYLSAAKDRGEIQDFEWVSRENAVSPYDFRVITADGKQKMVDVKSTQGEFQRRIHISLNEILTMADPSSDYHLYRVYEIDADTAKLRTTVPSADVSGRIRDAMERLPEGVKASSFSMEPDIFSFGLESTIRLDVRDEE